MRSGLSVFSGLRVILAGVDFGATAEADFNAAVDLALNTAVPGSPTADSINERIKTMDDADMPAAIAAIPTTAMRGTDNAMLATSGARILCPLRFKSELVEEIQLNSGATTLAAIATVTVEGLPSGAVITHAYLSMASGKVENIHATLANGLDGATVANTSQVVQLADDTPGTYYDAINFPDDYLTIAATTREGGDLAGGNINLAGAGKVDGNDGYIIRWLLSKAHQDFLNLNNVQFYLDVLYSV